MSTRDDRFKWKQGDITFLHSKVGDALLHDSIPRTLYVRRQVINAPAIRRWAKQQGFPTVVEDDQMHVTIAYSKTPVDWLAMGEAPSTGEQNWIVVPDGGPRIVERFGPGMRAVVLGFASGALTARHEQMRRDGASWDWPQYDPHVTLSYQVPATFDLGKVVPYRGPIELGPEIFEEVPTKGMGTVAEDAGSDDEPRDEHGKWTGSSGGDVYHEAMLKYQAASEAWKQAQSDYSSGKIGDDEFDKAEAAFKELKSPWNMSKGGGVMGKTKTQ